MNYYIKFNKKGLVNMWTTDKQIAENNSYHLLSTDQELPEDFKQNSFYYQVKIEYSDLVGIELRDDLEEFKKEQELLMAEINKNLI